MCTSAMSSRESVQVTDYTQTPCEIVNVGNNKTVSLPEMIRPLEDVLGVRDRAESQPPSPETFRRRGRMSRRPGGFWDIGQGFRLKRRFGGSGSGFGGVNLVTGSRH